LGSSASKRISDERGRFWGWETTSPSFLRTRQIVETEGTCSKRPPRWKAIVAAPQSWPSVSSCSRRETIASTISAEVRFGELRGALERRSRAP
jgi:hypothetical protein